MNTVLAVIFVFGILVFVHELGHFTVAKLVGIRVFEFSIGFGPKLINFIKGETRYTLRILPLGGFTRMAGMDDEEDLREIKKLKAEEQGIKVEEISEEDEKLLANLEASAAFKNKTVLQRMAVIFAGSFNNFVLALLIFFFIFFIIGAPAQDVKNPVIGQVVTKQNLPAEKVGLKPGDRVVSINGLEIKSWEELTAPIHQNPGKKLVLKIQRGQNIITKEITPITDQKTQRGVIGITAREIFIPQSFSKSVNLAAVNFKEYFSQITGVLGKLFVNKDTVKEISGPVGIVKVIGDAAKTGMVYILYLTAVISINLGIFNLLPIPALDGSRIIFLLLEALRGRPVDPNKENLVHMVGFALLMLLVVVITYRDIVKIFS